jgi:hypothetical protein
MPLEVPTRSLWCNVGHFGASMCLIVAEPSPAVHIGAEAIITGVHVWADLQLARLALIASRRNPEHPPSP